MADDKKKDDAAMKSAAEEIIRLLKKMKDDVADSDVTNIISGLGMMVHGLAHAVVSSTSPPDGFIELKEEYEAAHGDKLTQEIVERDYPEMAKKVEERAGEVGELISQCYAILKTPPHELVKEAVKLAEHGRVKQAAKAKQSEAMDFGDDDDGVEAPLPGWSMNVKGNA